METPTSTRRSSTLRGGGAAETRSSSGGSESPLTTTVPPPAPSSSAPVHPQQQVSSGGDNTGAIAGGVVGGVVGAILLVVLAGLLFWCLRRKKRAQQATYVHDVSQEPGPSYGDAAQVPSQRGATATETAPTIARTVAPTTTTAPAPAPAPAPATGAGVPSSELTGAGAGLAAGGLASAAPRQAPVATTPAPSAAVTHPPIMEEPADRAVGTAAPLQATSNLPYARPSRVSRSPPLSQTRSNSGQAVTPYADYADVDPTMWRDTWASADSPYGRAGVGHAGMEDEGAPPRAFHMQPGQLVSNASPVGAFSQPWNSGAQSQAVPHRSSRVIRESLGQGEAMSNERQ